MAAFLDLAFSTGVSFYDSIIARGSYGSLTMNGAAASYESSSDIILCGYGKVRGVLRAKTRQGTSDVYVPTEWSLYVNTYSQSSLSLSGTVEGRTVTADCTHLCSLTYQKSSNVDVQVGTPQNIELYIDEKAVQENYSGYKVLGWLWKVGNSSGSTSASGAELLRSPTLTLDGDRVKISSAKRAFYAPLLVKRKNIPIVWNGNGGTPSASSSSLLEGNSFGNDLPTATRTGYTFLGWFTEASGGSEITTNSTVPATDVIFGDAESVTYYAHWQEHGYTVKFANTLPGGEMADQSFTYSESKPLSACAFSGGDMWAFAGWNTAEDGSGASYSDAQTVSGLSDADGGVVTLYAQWRRIGFSVTVSKVAEDGESDVSGVGKLQLFRVGDDSPKAEESNGTLQGTGDVGETGVSYRVDCQLATSGSERLWEPVGLASRVGGVDSFLTYNQFMPSSGSELEYVFVLRRKPIYTLTFAANANGTAEVVAPEAPDADGGYFGEQNLYCKATPNPGYKLTSVTLKDSSGTTPLANIAVNEDGETFTINNFSQNAKAVLSFEKIDYSMSAAIDNATEAQSAITAVSVTKNNTEVETAQYGDTVVFSATVASNYSFAGWYDAETGEPIPDAGVSYTTTVTGPLNLVAKAKVAVALGFYYDENAKDSQSVSPYSCELQIDGQTVEMAQRDGHAYDLLYSFDVTLGESFSYEIVFGSGATKDETNNPDGLWKFDGWFSNVSQASSVIASRGASGTITPTAAVAMTAKFTDADGAQKTVEVFVVKIDSTSDSITKTIVDAEDEDGLVEFFVPVNFTPSPRPPTGNNGSLGAQAGGSESSGPVPYEKVVSGVSYVGVRVAANTTFSGESASKSFYGLSGSFTDDTSLPAVFSNSLDTVILVAANTTLYAYYGEARIVTVSLGYANGSSSSMGTISIVGKSDEDGDASIAANGLSADVHQGTTLTLQAKANNGYAFAGWFTNEYAMGDAAYDTPTATVTVLAQQPIFARFVQDATAICEWEGEDKSKTMTWRSKTYEANKPFAPSACRVDATGYPLKALRVEMFSAPNTRPTAKAALDSRPGSSPIATQGARRLPVIRAERYMQIEVESAAEVDAILVGTSMGGLAQ